MSNLRNIQRKLCEGISGWLLFEFHCLRGTIFNEKYLSYPIGQILNSITEYKTQAEINHPCTNNGKGRPLQVDFVLSNYGNHPNWRFAFESKWVGNSNISISAIIWDLIRLQNLFIHHPGIKCYFILSGFDKKISNELLKTFDIAFDADSTKTNGITSLSNSSLKFDLRKLDTASKKNINKNLIQYPKFTLFSKILCKPAHFYPKNDIINMTFSTYVFEILAPDNTHKIPKLI